MLRIDDIPQQVADDIHAFGVIGMRECEKLLALFKVKAVGAFVRGIARLFVVFAGHLYRRYEGCAVIRVQGLFNKIGKDLNRLGVF